MKAKHTPADARVLVDNGGRRFPRTLTEAFPSDARHAAWLFGANERPIWPRSASRRYGRLRAWMRWHLHWSRVGVIAALAFCAWAIFYARTTP